MTSLPDLRPRALNLSRRPRTACLRSAALGLLLLAPAFAFPAAPSPAAPPARIPDVHALSFSGDRVDLPDMLQGKVAILVLGFSKGSRAQTTLWGRRLPTDYFYSSDVLYFEMPVLASVPRLLRPAVLRTIKSAVSSLSQPHFVALNGDEQRWRSLVHYTKPDDAYVLLIDSNGLVKARLQGEPTDASYQDLRQQVDHLLTTSPR